MEHYQQGRAHETGILIHRISPELFRFFLAQQATRNEAHDLLQETWLRIHRARHTYQLGAPLMPWVFAIARRVRVDGFRKRARILRNEQGTDNLAEFAHSESPQQSSGTDVQQILAMLPDGQREVVTLLKVNGLSLDEVSRATGLTIGAVKQKASRAYAALRGLVKTEGRRSK